MTNHTTSSAVACARVQNSRSSPPFTGQYRRVYSDVADSLAYLLPRTPTGKLRRATNHAMLLDLVAGKQRHYGGNWRASISYLAYCLSISQRHLQRIAAELAELGVLMIDRGGKQGRDTSAYHVNYERLDNLIDRLRGDKMSPLNGVYTLSILNETNINLTAEAETMPDKETPASGDTSGPAASKDANKQNKIPASTRELYNALTDNLVSNGIWDYQEKLKTLSCIKGLVKVHGAERVNERLQFAIASDGYMLETGAIFYDWLHKGLESGYGLADEDYYGGNRYKDEQPTGILPELAASLTANSYTARHEYQEQENPIIPIPDSYTAPTKEEQIRIIKAKYGVGR